MYRILVADDEAIERKVLLKKLRQKFGEESAVFYEAENGREVLKLYEEKGADILGLGGEMPGVTGRAASRGARCAERGRVRDGNAGGGRRRPRAGREW